MRTIVDTEFADMIETYIFQEGLNPNNRGFTKLVQALGYEDLEEFLDDNSGAFQAMIEWIKGARNLGAVGWKESLEARLPEDWNAEDEDEEDVIDED